MTDHARPAGTTTASNLRDALRLHTAQDHTLLDSELSQLDLSDAEGRALFSRIQLRGYRRLAAACQWKAAEATDQLRLVISALQEDVHNQIVPDTPQTVAIPALAPDAVAYVTLGSQLGLAVLRRGLPEEDRAGLFALTPDTNAWRVFCARQRLAPATGPEADRILQDATEAFRIFRDATRTELSFRQAKAL